VGDGETEKTFAITLRSRRPVAFPCVSTAW